MVGHRRDRFGPYKAAREPDAEIESVRRKRGLDCYDLEP